MENSRVFTVERRKLLVTKLKPIKHLTYFDEKLLEEIRKGYFKDKRNGDRKGDR